VREIGRDLLGECRALANLCETLTPDQWRLRTDFYDWTPWDEIAHLALFDEGALDAVSHPERFAIGKKALLQRRAQGEEMSTIARHRFEDFDGPSLLMSWREHFESLGEALSQLDPRARLPWYGPEMSARSFATARLMETWAHGQDIWDLLQRTRGPSPGLRHIAHLGVNTYGWAFVNRNLPVPQPIPFVDLVGPDGSRWTWGVPSVSDYVRGTALDFALLVTQRRHRADTGLEWAGEGAEQWTLIAQCFAGAPATGPAPGVRGDRA
jgi:uncharacterized protein (TIGR03084 family)